MVMDGTATTNTTTATTSAMDKTTDTTKGNTTTATPSDKDIVKKESFAENVPEMPDLYDEDADAWFTTGTAGLGAPELGILDDDEIALRTKLSFELLPLATTEDTRGDSLFSLDPTDEDCKFKGDPSLTLQKRLEIMHRSLLDWIQRQPKEKQPQLHQMVSHWAKQLQTELQERTEENQQPEVIVSATQTTVKKKNPRVLEACRNAEPTEDAMASKDGDAFSSHCTAFVPV